MRKAQLSKTSEPQLFMLCIPTYLISDSWIFHISHVGSGQPCDLIISQFFILDVLILQQKYHAISGMHILLYTPLVLKKGINKKIKPFRLSHHQHHHDEKTKYKYRYNVPSFTATDDILRLFDILRFDILFFYILLWNHFNNYCVSMCSAATYI